MEIVHGLDWPSVDKTVGSKRHSPNGSGLHRHTLGRTDMLLGQSYVPMKEVAALSDELGDLFVVVVAVVLDPVVVYNCSNTVTVCVTLQ